jgi:hypothetical protein
MLALTKGETTMSLLFSQFVLCAVLAGGAVAGLLALATTMTRRDAASRTFAFGLGAIVGLIGGALALSSWFITGAAGPAAIWISATPTHMAGAVVLTLAAIATASYTYTARQRITDRNRKPHRP